MHDCFDWKNGQKPTVYQDEILSEISIYDRYAYVMARGGGKTALESWLTWWFSLTRDEDGIINDWKILTTAGAWSQLTNYLWPEIHKWARLISWWKTGREALKDRTELLDTDIKLKTGKAFAIASDRSDLMEGAHAAHVFCLFDEAKIIPVKSWDSMEGVFSGQGSDTVMEGKWVAGGKAGDMQGRFYDIHRKREGLQKWKTRHVTIDEIIKAGRISSDWVESVRKLWGEESVLFKNEVLGEFASNTADAIIPLSWIEAAIDRWRVWDENGRKGKLTAIGVDVGGGLSTSDASVIVPIVDEMKVHSIRPVATGDPQTATMALVGNVHNLLDQAGTGTAIIDKIGIGLGVLHRLREQGDRAAGFGAGDKTMLREKSGERGFLNWRAAMWWVGREILEPGSGFNVCLPPDDRMIGELTAPHSTIVSNGLIKVEPKVDIRKRIGHSTDYADAILMGLVGPTLLNELARNSQEPEVTYDPVRIW